MTSLFIPTLLPAFLPLRNNRSPDKPLHLTIFSTSGKSLKTVNIRTGNPENEYLIDVSGLVTGVYLISIKTELRTVLKKLIIK